jgi:hypothetical protein
VWKEEDDYCMMRIYPSDILVESMASAILHNTVSEKVAHLSPSPKQLRKKLLAGKRSVWRTRFTAEYYLVSCHDIGVVYHYL